MRRFVALLTVVTLAGCMPAPQAPPPAAQNLLHYYDYSPVPLKGTLSSTDAGDGYRVEHWTLTPADGTALDSIRLDWYRVDRPGRHPAVLMSPILAGNDLYVREFARFYAARRMHAVMVYRKKEAFSAQRPLSDIEGHLHDSVVQLRRVLDWLETKESVDPQRIGAFAISMGAILTTLLTAVEPRIRCAVLGLAAGHVPEILMTSQDKGILKRRNNYLQENKVNPEELLARLRGVIRSEPLAAAALIPPEKVLMIAGRFDRVLGFQRSLDLWRAMGRPRLIVLPTGHYTAYLAAPYLKIATYSFLKRSFKSTLRKTVPGAAFRPRAVATQSSG